MKNFLRKTIILFLIIFFFLGSVLKGELSAFASIVEREDWQADDQLLSAEDKYNFPSRIIVSPIYVSYNLNNKESLRDLYYYYTTRSGFGDIPFHYVVDENGNIYEGNSTGPEALVTLGDIKGAVFIGYLTKNPKKMGVSSIRAIEDILIDVANRYAINVKNIQLKEMQVTFGQRARFESVTLKDPDEGLKQVFDSLANSVEEAYDPEEIEYNLQFVEVSVPEKKFSPGDIMDIKIKMKNAGESALYSSVDRTLVATRKGEDQPSQFYYLKDWDSKQQVVLLEEGERFAPGDEKEFSIKFKVPLYPPEYKESFMILGPYGSKIENSDFDVSVRIEESDKEILEVQETEVGFLNVRKTPGLGEVISKVSPGERFFIIDSQPGYYKIEANDKEGWVVSMYVKVI